MAELTGFPALFTGNTTVSESAASTVVGTLAQDVAGNLYRYVKFGFAAITGEVVVMDSAWSAARLSNTSRGFVGITLANQTTNYYGWVQIYGVNTFCWADTGVTTADPVLAPVTTDLGHLAVQTSGDVSIGIWGIHASTAPDSCASTALGTSAVSAPCTVILAHPFITGAFSISS